MPIKLSEAALEERRRYQRERYKLRDKTKEAARRARYWETRAARRAEEERKNDSSRGAETERGEA